MSKSLPPIPNYGNQIEGQNNTKASDSATQSKKAEKKSKDTNSNKSGSWFGGFIWDKLALRPKNQMKLPEDTNPQVSKVAKLCNKRWPFVMGLYGEKC